MQLVMRRCRAIAVVALAIGLAAQNVETQNRSEDEYTRYELLAPETASFKIIYDVTAVSPGAKFFFNPIRQGSVATDESVIDLMTGTPLKFQEVSGAEARESGLATAGLESRYIRVELARPVPQGGEGRIRIIKTYKDPKSYFSDGKAIVFDRPLGIKRNSVVLPPGYELVSCNIPSQVIEEADGRVGLSFMNTYPGQAPLVIRASPLEKGKRQTAAPTPPASSTARAATAWRSEPGAAADGASPHLRARFPGSRDRLLPQESRDARVQPLSRLHRNPRGRSTSTSTSCAPAARCRIHRQRFSTPAMSSRPRR